MQFSGDLVLADYLGGDRQLGVELLVDWDNNGFLSPYSDMSSLYEEITVERDLTGDVPDEVNLIEGYSIAKMTVKLSGRRDQDSFSISDLLSPWNKNSPFYGRDLFGLGIIYRIKVPLSGEVRKIDQFVGIIRQVDSGLEDQVEIVALDLMDLLNRSIILRPIAIDYFLLIFGTVTTSRQIFNLSWVIDQILRQCGLYQSPAAVLTSGTQTGYFCVTLSGAWFSEANSPVSYNTINDAINPPDLLFIPGKYGYAANGTVSSRGKYTYTVDPSGSWVKGESHCSGGWFYGPQACLENETSLINVTLTGDTGHAGRCAWRLFISSAGVVQLNLTQLTGQSYNITYTGPTIAITDWHYVGAAILWKLDGTIQVTFNVDGSLTTASNATVMLTPTYIQAYSMIFVNSNMPTQHVQWWKESSSTVVWPKDPPTTALGVSPQTNVALATTWISQVPDIYLEKGVDVLKELLPAELGVMLSTESGLIKFISRDGINSSRTSADSFTLTTEEMKQVKIHERVDSYRNLINTNSSFFVLLGQTVFKASTKEQFDTPASSVTRFLISVEDVYRITQGVPPFTNPWDPAILTGFHVTKISDGTIPSGVSVLVTVLNQKTLAVDVSNPNAFEVRLATSTGTPALNISGYALYEWTSSSAVYLHFGSYLKFGSQQLDMPKSPWRSRESSQQKIAESLLKNIATPIPVIDPVEVRGDPRRQLNDTCILNTARTGTIYTAVIGITRSLTKGSPLIDQYTLRPLHPPSFWLLGAPGYSELGSTTKLS